MNIRLTDLTVGAIVDGENGQFKVVAHWSDEKKTYLELEPIKVVDQSINENI